MTHYDHEWLYHYRPPTAARWEGRKDGHGAERFHERIRLLDLREEEVPSPLDIGFALLGFASDEGVKRNHGRVGAAEGPDKMRRMLAPLPCHLPLPYPIYDCGDIACSDGNLETAQCSLAKTVKMLSKSGILPILIGGGHEIAWGHFQGIQSVLENVPLSLVNIDAHFDLREPEEMLGNSGTSFWQMAEKLPHFDYTCFGIQRFSNTTTLFEKANTLGVHYVLAEDMNEDSQKKHLDRIIKKKNPIYLTICLDAFSSSLAPGVSAPQEFGVFPQQVLPLLQQIAHSGLLIGFDIAELNPKFDIDHRTARLGARLASFIMHSFTSHDSKA